MTKTSLKTRVASRVEQSQKLVFVREDFEDLGAYDQVGRALRQLVIDRRLLMIGHGLYANVCMAQSGAPLLAGSPAEVLEAAFARLGIDPDDKGRFSRKITIPDDLPAHPIPGHASQRLSLRLGLQFPYDWSNSQMKEDVLINKVIEKSRFEDVMRVAYYYGLSRIKRAAKQLYNDAMPTRLASILRNIEEGFRSNEDAA